MRISTHSKLRAATRPNMALAASLAALVIAAPIAFRQYKIENAPVTLGKVQTELQPGHEVAQQAPPVAVAQPESTTTEMGPKLALGVEVKSGGESAIARKLATDPAKPASEPRAEGRDAAGPVDAEAAKKSKIPDIVIAPPSASSDGMVAAMPQPPTTNAANGKDEIGAVGGYAGSGAYTGTKQSAAVPPSMQAAAPPYALGAGGGRVEQDRQLLNNMLGNLPIAGVAPGVVRERLSADSSLDPPHIELPAENRDKFDAKDINPVKQAALEPVSTFSIDVDTASYAFVRRALTYGHLPPKDAVRVEEMINYFPYAYPAPESAETPFKPTVTVLPSPWNPNNKLVHVAIKGYDLKTAERPRANIVLLMDVSGSMQPADRLPLVKNAFRLLVDQLKPDDTVGIVTYAGSSGIALEPIRVSDKNKILSAIDKLGAGGSTAGAAGIADAYRLAEAGFDKAAVNRVILATDGDFNVGITDQSELKSYIERKRQSGIFLSILGVGQGNHNDALMQTLAQNGNGTATYADTLNEARKVLVDESSSTLFTIAKDVKVQIEWNPARVAEYRLIGYETRALRREDFNNDRIDAGDIGSGHTVTAIYEVTPVGAPLLADDLRYGKAVAARVPVREAEADQSKSNELGFLKLRYKKPNEDASQLVTVPVTDALAKNSTTEIPTEIRFSVAVAAFGELVKGAPYTQGYTFDDVLALAQTARGDDPFGYRAEFLNLVRLAKSARP